MVIAVLFVTVKILKPCPSIGEWKYIKVVNMDELENSVNMCIFKNTKLNQKKTICVIYNM